MLMHGTSMTVPGLLGVGIPPEIRSLCLVGVFFEICFLTRTDVDI